ncbi:hypothetical protein [Sneathiella glossodoripedis]|uniref:hypothetical protein n=1 Tax=Sneathiella glossodoripedis TaxID=418853 RepID=UPI000472A8F6|nr:hypothetical protein [Sneathiella glossodoripedis]
MNGLLKLLICAVIIFAYPSYCSIRDALREEQYFVIGETPIFLPKYAFRFASQHEGKTTFVKTYIDKVDQNVWTEYLRDEGRSWQVIEVWVKNIHTENTYLEMLESLKQHGVKKYMSEFDLVSYGYGMKERAFFFPAEEYGRNAYITCWSTPPNYTAFYLCRGGFFYEGLTVDFFFEKYELKKWRQYFDGVTRFVEEIVEDGQNERMVRGN